MPLYQSITDMYLQFAHESDLYTFKATKAVVKKAQKKFCF